jgi:tripartite-type tricarboxylate transporter receptor subunit TctC
MKKTIAQLGLLFLTWALAGFAHAQGEQQAPPYPQRPVRLIVPVPAGSGLDTITRVLAQRLGTVWGQPVVVDNQPGANSIIGTAAAARAPADGHTLLVVPDGTLAVNPHMYAKLPYDPVKDLVAITQLVTFNQVLLAHPGLPAADLGEFIRYAKANPGKVSFGSYGVGSQPHLLGEMLKHDAGLDLLHVPYKGAPQALLATMTGETQLTWASPFTAAEDVRAGKLKPLAVASAKRSAQLPDVPTFREAGLPGIEWELWFGLFAPAGTPPALVRRIHADVSKLLADPEVRDKVLRGRGYEPSGLGPEPFAALLRRELAERGALVKRVGIKME